MFTFIVTMFCASVFSISLLEALLASNLVAKGKSNWAGRFVAPVSII